MLDINFSLCQYLSKLIRNNNQLVPWLNFLCSVMSVWSVSERKNYDSHKVTVSFQQGFAKRTDRALPFDQLYILIAQSLIYLKQQALVPAVTVSKETRKHTQSVCFLVSLLTLTAGSGPNLILYLVSREDIILSLLHTMVIMITNGAELRIYV